MCVCVWLGVCVSKATRKTHTCKQKHSHTNLSEVIHVVLRGSEHYSLFLTRHDTSQQMQQNGRFDLRPHGKKPQRELIAEFGVDVKSNQNRIVKSSLGKLDKHLW